jgi:hypothetical protein
MGLHSQALGMAGRKSCRRIAFGKYGGWLEQMNIGVSYPEHGLRPVSLNRLCELCLNFTS